MKKIVLCSVIALLLVVIGCSKIKYLTNINENIPYVQQIAVPQIPGDTAGIPLPAGGVSFPFPSFPVATNVQQYATTYKTSTNKIVSFELSSLNVSIISPANPNFDFLDSMEVYISGNSQPEVLVAYVYNVPKGLPTLALTAVPNVNLKDYFIQDTMYFRVNAHINAVPALGTQLNIASVFALVANPLD